MQDKNTEIRQNRSVSRRNALATLGGGLGVVGTAILTGCGGSSGGNTSPSTTATTGATNGRATLTIVWPARTTSRLLPVAANSVTVNFTLNGSVVATQTVARPASGSSTTVTFDALPVGDLTVQGLAYPNPDGTGIVQASATTTLTTIASQATPVTLTMASTIDHVTLTTYDPSIKVGTNTTLVSTAYDVNNNVVFVSASTVSYTALTADIATVDSTGKVTGVAVGTAQFRVVETESGKAATVTLPVTAASTPTPSPSPSPSPASCTLIPSETDGPYPLYSALSNSALRRSNITEGKTGVPLTLTLNFVNVGSSCGAISNAAVYIWQCDKDGQYSGYSSSQNGNHAGETYLRGVQVTDSNGQVTFTTIYPGWYVGRITHIHFEVFLNDNLSGTAKATSQLAFPQAITQTVYASSLYASHGQNSSVTSFTQDNVFSDGTTYQMLNVTGSVSAGYAATLTIGISGS